MFPNTPPYLPQNCEIYVALCVCGRICRSLPRPRWQTTQGISRTAAGTASLESHHPRIRAGCPHGVRRSASAHAMAGQKYHYRLHGSWPNRGATPGFWHGRLSLCALDAICLAVLSLPRRSSRACRTARHTGNVSGILDIQLYSEGKNPPL